MDPDDLQSGSHGSGRLGRLFAALVRQDHTAEESSNELPEAPLALGRYPDFQAFTRALLLASDSFQFLLDFELSLKSSCSDNSRDSHTIPDFTRWLKDRLEDANLAKNSSELAEIQAIRPTLSGLFYLRSSRRKLSAEARTALLKTEAALNLALLLDEGTDDVMSFSYTAILKSEALIMRSIHLQAASVAGRLPQPGVDEWSIRYALSFGIEAFRLPYRLTARFRVNAQRSLAAVELDLCPPALWLPNSFADGFGSVSNTAEMKRRAATEYNLRLALLVAMYAFLSCPVLERLKLAGIIDNGNSHHCYISADFSRRDIETLQINSWTELLAFFTAQHAILCDMSRELCAIPQGFSLDDSDLCPKERFFVPELSDRRISALAEADLGAQRVADLSIEEAARRIEMSEEVFRRASSSTTENVEMLLSLAKDSMAADVQDAAYWCVDQLISGELADEPEALMEAFICGCDFSADLKRARDLLQQGDVDGAYELASVALGNSGYEQRYRDSDAVIWRSFESYDDRVLFNLSQKSVGTEVRLVKDAYPEALAIRSAVALNRGDIDKALADAREVTRVSPLSPQASLHLARCLEQEGSSSSLEEARGELLRLLSFAHSSDAIGMAYLHLAQIYWDKQESLLAQACFEKAGKHISIEIIPPALSFLALFRHPGPISLHSMDTDEVKRVLDSAHIPFCPEPEMLNLLRYATCAAVNENLFVVAHELMRAWIQLEKDDVFYGLYCSLEREPDC